METIEQIERQTEGGDAKQATMVPTMEVIEYDSPMAEALSTNVASQPPSENAKLIRAMSKLDTFLNPDGSKTKTIATRAEQRVTRAQATNTAIIEHEGRCNNPHDQDVDIGNGVMDRNIHYLFGDITLFIKDTMLTMVETKEETRQLQANSVELQRLDDEVVGQLDGLTGDKHGLTKERHAVLMQNMVVQLKDQEATTYDEAFNHPANLKMREKYREVINKEFRKTTERKFWRKITKK
jgi:hypothetical protein